MNTSILRLLQRTQTVLFSLALLTLATAFVRADSAKPPANESKKSTGDSASQPGPNLLQKTTDDVEALVKKWQKRYVKHSKSPTDCFTDKDYDAFKANKTIDNLKATLGSDRYVISLAKTISGFDAADQEKVFDDARDCYHKPWSETGMDGDGQSQAGSDAERDIAEAVTTVLVQLVAAQSKTVPI